MADKARYAAVAALVRMHRGGYANLTAKALWAQHGLDARQTAFANRLFYTCAERLLTLDALLAPFIKQGLHKLDVEVRAILETGLAQMQYMQVPPRAAVHEAVQLTRAFKKSSASGLVNAVLRKAGQAKVEELQFASEEERISVLYSVGLPVARAVMQAFPKEYENFLAASFTQPELCLRANSLKTNAKQLAQLLQGKQVQTRPGQLPGSLYANIPGDISQEEYFKQGFYHVQGEASQYACANLQAGPGLQVLDACAAPGGKTATLAQYMEGGTGLTAQELRENRLPLITQALQRLGIEGVQTVLGNAAQYNPALAGQHRVLCDVPCSGLGVLAKKPDIRYAQGDNWEALPELQLAILTTSAQYVRQGGRLVYSTCTVRPQENAQVVKAFLHIHPDFTLVQPKISPMGALINEKMMTILPHLAGLDGFFVATLERL